MKSGAALTCFSGYATKAIANSTILGEFLSKSYQRAYANFWDGDLMIHCRESRLPQMLTVYLLLVGEPVSRNEQLMVFMTRSEVEIQLFYIIDFLNLKCLYAVAIIVKHTWCNYHSTLSKFCQGKVTQGSVSFASLALWELTPMMHIYAWESSPSRWSIVCTFDMLIWCQDRCMTLSLCITQNLLCQS